MTPFSPHDCGTDERDWREQPWWDGAPELGLPPRDTHLVVLAAHPDDETLGAGGLLHAAGRAGLRITVVLASDGQASHPESRTTSPAELGRVRRVEARAAVAVLARHAHVAQLSLPDGDLTAHVGQIADGVRDCLDDRDTWVLSTWSGDRHPDHAACASAAALVAAGNGRIRHLAFPIWLWHWGRPEEVRAFITEKALRFPVDADGRVARADALACYPSQLHPLSPEPGDEAVLPASMMSHFGRDREFFFDVSDRTAGDVGYFDRVYEGSDDPWGLQNRFYERRKREVVMASLVREHFRRTFEPGCARGDLSRALAARTDELVSADGSHRAVAAARSRCADLANVRVDRFVIPDDWPVGSFDLIVISEVGYYCRDLKALSRRIIASLDDDGSVVLVHWRRVAADHPHTAETVHAAVLADTGLHRIVRHEEDDFLLDVLSRDRRSVAQREGLR